MPDVGVVGIVANPASARDIRRLVAHGALVTTNDKVNMIERVLAGLHSVGVERALSMTDLDGISAALAGLAGGPVSKAWPTLEFVDQHLEPVGGRHDGRGAVDGRRGGRRHPGARR